MWSPILQDPFFGPATSAFSFEAGFLVIVFLLIGIWSLAWKMLGLWHAARNKQRLWFAALVLFNTVGVLEIVYLAWFQRDGNKTGTKHLFPQLDEWRKRLGLDSSAFSPRHKKEAE